MRMARVALLRITRAEVEQALRRPAPHQPDEPIVALHPGRTGLITPFGLPYARHSTRVPVAQRIERPPSKRQVVGSSPTGDANLVVARGTTLRLSCVAKTGM